jgi:hypothetical protein
MYVPMSHLPLICSPHSDMIQVPENWASIPTTSCVHLSLKSWEIIVAGAALDAPGVKNAPLQQSVYLSFSPP